MFNRKGQSTLEYALIIAVVVGGLLLMQHYVKRGYAGRLKTATDDVGEQFDPTAHESYFTINQYSKVNQTVEDGVSTTTHKANQESNRVGSETLNGFNVEDLTP